MPQAKLDQHCVNRSDLHPVASTRVAELGGLNVVLAIRLEERERGEPLNQLVAGLGSGEALEQFLKDQPSSEHLVCTFKSSSKHLDCLRRSISVASESQRPDGSVYEQAYDLRDRSAL